jgi:hypothetical protein
MINTLTPIEENDDRVIYLKVMLTSVVGSTAELTLKSKPK